MISYPINKGVGKQVEFRGLTAQYLIIFAVGLLGSFVLLIVLFIAGISQWICITAGIFSASGVVFITFSLNRKYGPYGLMKMVAADAARAGSYTEKASGEYSKQIQPLINYAKYF